MPPKLQVPEIYMPYIGELVHLSPDSMRALIDSLREEKLTLGLNEFAESIAKRLSIESATARGIAELLSSLYAVREGFGGDIGEFVAAFRSAIEETNKPDLQPDDWSAFQEAITAALSSESPLSLSAKALDVLTDHQRTFLYSRVLTDLRPVFRSNITEAPAAMVVVHTLKLVYRADGVPRELHVALDSRDVKQVIEVLQRAVDKEESLRKLSEAKGITLLEVTA